MVTLVVHLRYDDTVALIILDVMTTLHFDHLRYDDYATLIIFVYYLSNDYKPCLPSLASAPALLFSCCALVKGSSSS